jgi:hypothetical protein
MNMPWYEIAEASTPITQGDIIMNCPVAGWREAPFTIKPDSAPEEVLKMSVDILQIDTIVMTQACSLRSTVYFVNRRFRTREGSICYPLSA